ncbi:MAG: N-acetylmuramoyl-L-alanine amidase, partial [Candidatus Omnitrophota bacterium]
STKGMKEKDLNLKVAKLLKDDLAKTGFKVVLTRNKDVFLSLKERVDVAKKINADLFISIHANSNRARFVRGVEFYYLSPVQFDSQERAGSLVKEKELWASKGLSDEAQAILWDMLLTKNYALSVDFVNRLYSTFKNLGFKVRTPKSASFYVLKCASVPSILIEMGYLSNKYEERSLGRKSYQKQISEAIALSVVSLNKRYTSLVKK